MATEELQAAWQALKESNQDAIMALNTKDLGVETGEDLAIWLDERDKRTAISDLAKHTGRSEVHVLRNYSSLLNAFYKSASVRASGDGEQANIAKAPLAASVQACVSRLMHGDECVGTASLIASGHDAWVMTAWHCIEHEHGQNTYLPVEAFGQPLQLRAVSRLYDVAFLSFGELKYPPTMKPLTFGPQPLRAGDSIYLLAFPKAVDRGLVALNDTPVFGAGTVNKVYATGRQVAGDYHGGMPNASGAPVLNERGECVGMHFGTEYYRQPTVGYPDEEEPDLEDIIEFGDAFEIAQNSTRTSSAFSTDSAEDVSGKLRDLAIKTEHAVRNIQKKEHLCLFVPSSELLKIMEKAGVTDQFRKEAPARNCAKKPRR